MQLVVAFSEDVRRVVREMLPRLPDEVGGGSGKLLADVRWATLDANLPPKLELNFAVQARDADAEHGDTESGPVGAPAGEGREVAGQRALPTVRGSVTC